MLLLPPALLPGAAALGFAGLNLVRGPLARARRQFGQKLGPGGLAVRRLRALPLAAHLDPGAAVSQPNRGRGLVDFLPARTAPADEPFLNFFGANAQLRQLQRNLG